MKLSDALKGFEIARLSDSYSPNPMGVYLWALTRLTDYLDNPELPAITPDDLRRFMYYLRNEYAPDLPPKYVPLLF